MEDVKQMVLPVLKVRVEEHEPEAPAEIVRHSRNFEEEEKQRNFEKSGVGRKYVTKRLTDFKTETDEQKKNLETVNQIIAQLNNMEKLTVWMCGKAGTGKTMLASMIIRECGGHFCKSYQIADEIEDTKSFHSTENKSNLIARYAKYKVLVIDEIAKFDWKKEQELEYLFRILNERYENNVSTIVITNKTKQELANYLGSALFDRFVENCTCLEFTGNSYRKIERENNER